MVTVLCTTARTQPITTPVHAGGSEQLQIKRTCSLGAQLHSC